MEGESTIPMVRGKFFPENKTTGQRLKSSSIRRREEKDSALSCYQRGESPRQTRSACMKGMHD